VLLFRDYAGWEEPALTTPFGFMALRNLLVLGVFGALAGALYSSVVPANMDMTRDWVLVLGSLSPLGAGLALSMIKTPFGTSDSILLSLLVLGIRHVQKPRKQTRKKSTGRQRSRVLGFPRRLMPVSTKPDDQIHDIVCADLDELKSIRVTLHGGDGSVLGNQLVKCYLDNELLDTVRTSTEGSLVLHVRPEREGGRSLVVRSHDDNTVLLRKPLQFVHRMN